MKKYLIPLFKIILSFAILLFLFYKIDIPELMASFRQSDRRIVLFCIFFYGIGQILSTYKWSLLVKSHGMNHPFRNLLAYYYIGMFFNLFMPSVVGGDIQRCYALNREEKKINPTPSGRLTQIISSILMERTTGLIAIIWLATLSYFLFRPIIVTPTFSRFPDKFIEFYLPIILLLLFSGTILFIGFLYWNRFKNNNMVVGQPSGGNILVSSLLQPIYRLVDQLKSYLISLRFFGKIILISLLFQSMMILLNIFLGYSIGLEIPLIYYFIVIPLITLFSAIPISLGGLGIREGAYVYFFTLAGADITRALLLSLLYVIVVGLNALIGGIILFKKGFYIEKNESKIN